MNTKVKNIVVVAIFLFMIAYFSFSYFMVGTKDASVAERRDLAQFPKITAESLGNGKFMKDFESFSLDQFPFRDKMRTFKAVVERGVFGNPENNDYYYYGGHLANIMYHMDEKMLDVALSRFNFIYDEFVKDTGKNVYFSLIPDKNAYLAKDAGIVSVDYDKYTAYMINGMPDEMTYIDISDKLSADDFYFTDQHWRQEKIIDVADKLSQSMGNPSLLEKQYTQVDLDIPFYGTYYFQSALPGIKPDSISYITNENIKNCRVGMPDSYGKLKSAPMYALDKAKADSKDPYEMFLSGTQAFVIIRNDNADTDKELIIFRDSFGSSISPILAQSYKKITLVDTRYATHPDMIRAYADFENADDVLFMYSTLIVDAATALSDLEAVKSAAQ